MTNKEMKFEEALDRLEKIVEKMEGGGLPLEQAIKMFEEGSELRRFCEEKLKETERRVEQIIKKEYQDKKAAEYPEKMKTSALHEPAADEASKGKKAGGDGSLF
jgi:exodeoxyribonuclease VII small subunit